eukprot:scaffold6247_cov416-Prasinococcus_capsulatus_cf.AAC.8
MARELGQGKPMSQQGLERISGSASPSHVRSLCVREASPSPRRRPARAHTWPRASQVQAPNTNLHPRSFEGTVVEGD